MHSGEMYRIQTSLNLYSKTPICANQIADGQTIFSIHCPYKKRMGSHSGKSFQWLSNLQIGNLKVTLYHLDSDGSYQILRTCE